MFTLAQVAPPCCTLQFRYGHTIVTRMKQITLRIHRIVLLLGLLASMPAARADDAHWIKLGQARYSILLWSVYDVVLEAPQREFRFPDSAPFAMTFEYRRDVDAEDILDIVQQQWRAQRVQWPSGWLEQLRLAIPDVLKGDQLRVEVNADHTATIQRNGKLLTTIADPELVRAFAGIWLSDKSTYTGMRRQLLQGSL